MDALARISANGDPENPFPPLAAEGYAYTLLDDVADRSSLASRIVAELLKAQTWMEHAGLRDAMKIKGNAFAQACTHVDRNRKGFLDSTTLGGEKFLRLNPEAFVRERERMIGESLEPAIVRTIALARLRHRAGSFHPVLDRAEEVFSHMEQCLPWLGFPVGQQVGFLMAALSGERGFAPHAFKTLNAPNQDAMEVMMDKFQRPNLQRLRGYRLADFFTQEEEGSVKSARIRTTATPALIEFLGGAEAIFDLKRRVLDADGNFPLPIHGMSAEALDALGKTFIETHGGDNPPSDAPPPATEKYRLDPRLTYKVTRRSEQTYRGRKTYLYPWIHDAPLTVLTPQTDFRPYIDAILQRMDLPVQDLKNIAMVKNFLDDPDGSAKIFTVLSEAITDPSEEVLVGYTQGGASARITVVKAAVLVPYTAHTDTPS